MKYFLKFLPIKPSCRLIDIEIGKHLFKKLDIDLAEEANPHNLIAYCNKLYPNETLENQKILVYIMTIYNSEKVSGFLTFKQYEG